MKLTFSTVFSALHVARSTATLISLTHGSVLQLAFLALEIFVDIHDGTLVDVAALDEVDDDGEDDEDTPHEHRPVHADRSDLLGGREEAHGEGENNVQDGDNVDWDGEATHAPSGWWERLSTKALEEDAADGDKVGGEERRNEERDDGVEGRRAANVDKSEDDGDEQGQNDSVERDLGTQAEHLAPDMSAWETVVASEGKGLARGSCQDGNASCDKENDWDASQDGSTSLGTS